MRNIENFGIWNIPLNIKKKKNSQNIQNSGIWNIPLDIPKLLQIYIYIYIYGGVKFYQGSNSRGKIYVKYEMKYFCILFRYFFLNKLFQHYG